MGIQIAKCENTPHSHLRTKPVQEDTPGARIRNARLQNGMSIADLAKAAGLSEKTISDLENDKHTATPSTIKALAHVLNLPIYYVGHYDELPQKTIGQMINKARLYHGLTKKELAAALDVDVHTVMNWERDRQKPSPTSLSKLSRFLAAMKCTQ